MDAKIKRLRRAIGKDPSNHALTMKLAKLLVEDVWRDYSHDKFTAHYTEAREIYESVLVACPNNAVALVNLGAVLSDQGHHKQAVKQFLLAQRFGWQDANLEFNLGVALLNLQDERAHEHLIAAGTKTKHAETLQAYFDPQAH